jgi:hypothetical protein
VLPPGDGVERRRKLLSPGRVPLAGAGHGVGERVQARGIAHGVHGGKKRGGQRPVRLRKRLAQIVQSDPAAAQSQRLMEGPAKGKPLPSRGSVVPGGLTRTRRIDQPLQSGKRRGCSLDMDDATKERGTIG